mgnify:CR=1 FL=1
MGLPFTAADVGREAPDIGTLTPLLLLCSTDGNRSNCPLLLWLAGFAATKFWGAEMTFAEGSGGQDGAGADGRSSGLPAWLPGAELRCLGGRPCGVPFIDEPAKDWRTGVFGACGSAAPMVWRVGGLLARAWTANTLFYVFSPGLLAPAVALTTAVERNVSML